MAAAQGLTALVDELIVLFNARAMDLPDELFDRRTQFVLNGAPFETLLGQPPDDPLVLMLARGAAGYRFMAKSLQHALPDARVERGDVITTGDERRMTMQLWLSGTLRGTGEALNTVVDLAVTRADSGRVAVAAVSVDPGALDQIRIARLQP
jgi:hypothetical protein